MYLFGIKKWYANWVLALLALGVFPPFVVYMFYRIVKELNKESSNRQYDEYLLEEAREEERLEELRKIRKAIEQNK